MGRGWFIAALCIGVSYCLLACQRLTPAPLLLIFAQSLVIAFLVASHHAGQVVHTAAHIPLENRTTALWIDIHVLLVAFDKQFILAIAVKVGELVALPVFCAKVYAVSRIFSLDKMVVNSRAHMAHINATKQAMPVGIVVLALPQLHQSLFLD